MTTKLIVIAGFLVAFAAGLVTGVQRRDVVTIKTPPTDPRGLIIPPTGPTTRQVRPAPNPSFFSDRLGLTPDQREKLAKIWEPVARQGARQMEETRWQLRQERDKKIIELVSEDNRAAYEKILADYSETIEKMDEQWRAEYDKAREQSKQILTAEQQQTYEQILARLQDERPRGGRGGRGGRGPRQGPPGEMRDGPPPGGWRGTPEGRLGGPQAGQGTTRPAAD